MVIVDGGAKSMFPEGEGIDRRGKMELCGA